MSRTLSALHTPTLWSGPCRSGPGGCPGRRTMIDGIDGLRRNHPAEPRKRGPRMPFTDEELTARIRQEIAVSPFTGEGPPKVLGAPEGGRCPDLQDPGTASDAGGPAAGAPAPGRSHREEGA